MATWILEECGYKPGFVIGGVLTLLLLMFFSSTNRAPRALGEIYDKGKR